MTGDKEFVDELERCNFLKKLPGNDTQPMLAFRGPMTRLIRALRNRLLREFTQEGEPWEEWTFPRIIPESVLAKTGWLTYHREEAWFLGSKTERNYSEEQKTQFPAESTWIPPTPYVLDPIQCAPLYQAFSNTAFDAKDLPKQVFEYEGGWTHRLEWDNPDGLFRAFSFKRLELIWIGSKEQSKSILCELLARTYRVLNAEVELTGVELHEGDPCFLQRGEPTRDDSKPLKWPTQGDDLPFTAYDVIVRRGDDTLREIGSAGRHDKLITEFNISCKDPTIRLESGCLGLGLNRIAMEFLKQKGTGNREKWPKWIRSEVFPIEKY